MTEIAIGKYTLESLTSGMYLSPKVLFREYIQNSIDSIDEAVERKLITRNDGKVVITIDKNKGAIIIEDNGCGIPESIAAKTLLDIGNSKKFLDQRRGFRGIGRLVGLSFSKRLKFETSFHGESGLTEITFDNSHLNELLTPGKYDHYDLKAVIRKATSTYGKMEDPEAHYFRVTLEGVENIDNILDKEYVADYVSQIAPLPYSPSKFSFYPRIHEIFRENNLELEEYNIYIKNNGGKEEQLFKLNRDQFLTDKQRRIWDLVKNIEIEKVINKRRELIAIVWYSKSDLLGTILNDNIKGLRLRKGNILIGDKTTLNCIFKEDRFNGWFQGEVFVFDRYVIPNARRDNFERNSNYQELLEHLSIIGNKLSKLIRDASNLRNKNKIIDITPAMDQLNFSHDEDNVQENRQIEDNSSLHERNLFRQLQVLRNPCENQACTKYNILNLSTNFTISEKRVLSRVFDVLQDVCKKKEAERIISSILERLNIN